MHVEALIRFSNRWVQMMKLSRYALPLLVVGLLFLAVARVIMADVSTYRQLQAMKQKQTAIQQETLTMNHLHDRIFRLVVDGQQEILPVTRVALLGSLALANRAKVGNLRLDAMGIRGGSLSSEVDLQALATPVPYTDGHLRKLSLVMKLGFSSLKDLAVFIGQISACGGYLAAIHIGQKSTILLIGFLGG